jgi:hypothetical protein
MDRILKLVYDNWYEKDSIRVPIPNGIHPAYVAHIRDKINEQPAISAGSVKYAIQHLIELPDTVKFRNGNNFIQQFVKHFNESDIISTNEISDDDNIYMYLIEIRTTIESLILQHTLIHNNVKYEYNLFGTMSEKIQELIRSGKVKLVIDIVVDPVQSDSAARLEEFMNNHIIRGKNIFIISGTDDMPEYKKDVPDGFLNLVEASYLLFQSARQLREYPCVGPMGYLSDIVRESDLDKNVFRKKKFLCFNRQLNYREHKTVMAYLAIKHDLLKEGIFSFISLVSEENIVKAIKSIYPVDSTDIEIIAKQIFELLPYEIDTHALSTEQKTAFGTDNNRKDLFLDTYFHLTMETRFRCGSTPFLSEKTFRPISNLQPFLYFGNHHGLAKLHKYGFKTFHPIIDESYDLEEDSGKRMLMLEKELIKLNNRSLEEIHDLYYSLTDILIYNQKHLASFEQHNPYQNLINSLRAN